MRTLWSIISFLAVVHLLALLMFIGWLWQSERLTAARVHEAKSIFAITLPEEVASNAKAQQEQKAKENEEIEALRDANPSVDSASQVRQIALIKQQEDQSRRRLEDEKKLLLGQLAQNAEQLNAKQAELDRLRNQWEQATSGDQKRKSDEQFLQAVRQFEQLPPKQGKRMIIELINLNQQQQAVAYLAAMNTRAASKIFREFKTDAEVALATELLEQLRTRGMEGQAAGADQMSATPPAPAATQDLGNASAPDRESP